MIPGLTVAPHPTLRIFAFATTFPDGLGNLASPLEWMELLKLTAATPLARSEELRAAVRDMLRHGGYKPTGRGKPASEYLVRAAEEGGLRSINIAVDACNITSLHSGLPISVIDIERGISPFHIAIASPGTKYIFNPAGQEIDIGGLVCLFDGAGACGNAVKDSQRTKTGDATRRTLSVIWGCAGFEMNLSSAAAWYQQLLADAGAATTPVAI